MRLPEPDDARVALGAAMGAFASSGGLDDLQRSVFASLARDLFRLDLETEPIDALTADELMAVAGPQTPQHAVSVMAVLEMVATPLTRAAADGVTRYARKLGVREGALDGERERARGHLRAMHADFLRSSWYTQQTIHGMLHGQFRELIESKLAYQGVAPNRAIAEKWLALRDLPPGSWGRGVADFYERHDFPFPGEKRGIYEIGARHDFVHVLTDYETSPEGEIDVFAFIAATMPGDQGMALLAVTMGLFQNGTITRASGKRIPNARKDTLLDPGAIDRFTDALRRGSLCTTDVMALDHFALADRQLDDLRRELNVVPPAAPAV